MIPTKTKAAIAAAIDHSNSSAASGATVGTGSASGKNKSAAFCMPHLTAPGTLMSIKDDLENLRDGLHSLDVRVVKLEMTVKVAVGLLGLLEVVLKIWSLLPGGH